MRCSAALPLMAVCSILLFSAQKSQAVVTFTAFCTLNVPTVGAADIHTGMLHVAMVPVTTTNHKVTISGATGGQNFNVQWSMHVELDGNIDVNSKDYSTTTTGLITCDPMGNWTHNASGNGQINGSFMNQNPGTHAGRGYCDFVDNNNAANNKNVTTASRNVTVVDP